ncbi:hypothetical protein E2C01_050388 [Portunus trituberculatus]|uniref:Uncharacterized protein n=1 Tax=Portunus trituberculatus TaxID=210409 RepID=A0A5B7GGM8_PORTR|nr:hypothetical protein [Portunus trituberculatus]
MVPASAADANITGGCHAVVPGAGKVVYGALDTFCTVYRGGIGDSHWSTMPSGRPTTWDMEVNNCHTAPMPGSQIPIRDIDGGVCHTAPMPGGQPLIPSHGFIRGSDKEMPSAPGTSGSVYGGGVSDSHRSTMPGGCLTTQEMEVGICHTAPMPGSQTPFQDVEVSVCHTAPMPGDQPIIPSRGLGVSETIPRTLGVELSTIMSDGLLHSQSVSVGTSHKTPMLVNQTHVPCVEQGLHQSDGSSVFMGSSTRYLPALLAGQLVGHRDDSPGMHRRHPGCVTAVCSLGYSDQSAQIRPGTQPKEAVPGHGAGFSKNSGFSVARKDQPVSLSGAEFFRGQSPYSVSMEVIPGSSRFPGEACPRWPGTLSAPSVVPEKSLEGSVGPSFMAGSSFTVVSGRPLLVDGSSVATMGLSAPPASSPPLSQVARGSSPSHVETLQHLFRKRGFSRKAARFMTPRPSPYEPLRLASLRDVALKSSFLLALASAVEVRHSKGWASMTFSLASDFLAKTQLPVDVLQSDFTIPALSECPVRAIREYLRRTRDCCPRCSRFFVTDSEPWHVVHPHTISHWICQVIQCAHVDVSEEEIRLVQVKEHEVRAVATSALFRKIRNIPAVLRAGTWKSMSTFASFYLMDITHRYLDTFSLGPVVLALRGESYYAPLTPLALSLNHGIQVLHPPQDMASAL